MSKKAAIYHFTNESKQRPRIYQKQLNILKYFAESLGFEVSATDVYCDMSLKRCERTEFDRFLENCEQYDALITKDFYHISKNTMQAMSLMKELRDKGVQIYTIENGHFSWDEAPFEKPLRVATYCCRFGTKMEMHEIIPVQNDILRLFSKKKTNWTVIDQYFDESFHQNDGEQPDLMKLLANKDKYDLLLVHNLNDVHWRTANFCKIREHLQLDIYSLQEGYLHFQKGNIT
jgi:DNA invertase Pin-like site-specific DNA recombinase